jgi:hypothetical protein
VHNYVLLLLSYFSRIDLRQCISQLFDNNNNKFMFL